jgi:hypothetical protein
MVLAEVSGNSRVWGWDKGTICRSRVLALKKVIFKKLKKLLSTE